MSYKLLLSSCVFAAISMHSYAAKTPTNCNQEVGKLKCLEFIKNYDGDTASFNIPNLHPLLGKELKISLIDVRTPVITKKDQCVKSLAKKAKYKLNKLLKNAKYIEVTNIKRDRSFGLKAKLLVDGKDISKILLKEKLAVPNKIYKKHNWCS